VARHHINRLFVIRTAGSYVFRVSTIPTDPPAELGESSGVARRVADLRAGSADAMGDPRPLYDELRAHGPFVVGDRRWIVSGYDPVR
jgi:cytochrome P450